MATKYNTKAIKKVRERYIVCMENIYIYICNKLKKIDVFFSSHKKQLKSHNNICVFLQIQKKKYFLVEIARWIKICIEIQRKEKSDKCVFICVVKWFWLSKIEMNSVYFGRHRNHHCSNCFLINFSLKKTHTHK